MTPRQALAAAAAIVATAVGLTWGDLSAPEKERVARYTLKQLLSGETMPAGAPEALCIQFEALRNDDGSYYQAQLLAEPGVDRTAQHKAILSRRATVIPSSIELIDLGSCLATSQDPLRWRKDQGESVRAGVYDLECTIDDGQGGTTTVNRLGYRGRLPAGCVVTSQDGVEVQCPTRVVLGHDPCAHKLGVARGEIDP